jgi:hypothetical protein
MMTPGNREGEVCMVWGLEPRAEWTAGISVDQLCIESYMHGGVRGEGNHTAALGGGGEGLGWSG